VLPVVIYFSFLNIWIEVPMTSCTTIKVDFSYLEKSDARVSMFLVLLWIMGKRRGIVYCG
jgi:hypothetical protein